jgi:hypothetical protein
VPRAEKRKRLSGIYLRRSVLLHKLDTYRTMSFEAYSGFQKEMTPREPDSDAKINIALKCGHQSSPSIARVSNIQVRHSLCLHAR